MAGGNSLRFGKTSGTSRCTILVVTSDDSQSSLLLDELVKTNTNQHNNVLQINACESVLAATQTEILGHSDYVVLIVNPWRSNWCNEVEENVANLEKTYLCGRFCLVVDTGRVSEIDTESLEHVYAMRKKYSAIVLFGEFNRCEILEHLSVRVITFVKTVCSNGLGVPFLTEFLLEK